MPGGSGLQTVAGSAVILVVDDEPDIRESLQEYMEGLLPGGHVLTAPSGPKGLEILARQRVDVVVSDFKMPDMDGIKFLAKVREFNPRIKRLLWTAYASNDVEDRARIEADVDALFDKSGDVDRLVTMVQSWLAGGSAVGVAAKP